MPLFTDQTGRDINLHQSPTKIISVVPSQTELLYTLGLNEEVIGITKFCVHPEKWFRTKTRVGGTKQLNLEQIKQLEPQLILANKEENVKEQIEELAQLFPVWVSDVHDVETALQMIEEVGNLTGKANKAQILITSIRSKFSHLLPLMHQPQKAAYLIWRNPYMTVGGDTFIHNMLQYAGFTNVFSDSLRYPKISITDLQQAQCELLLLSSEPYPFKEKHIKELQEHLPNTQILLVDGEMFSWYGSRLLQAPDYFQQLNQQISAMHKSRNYLS